MKLLQILLPLYDNGGEAYPKAMFDRIRSELTDAFGGVTAFLRSPAVGLWEDESGEVQRDDVVLVHLNHPLVQMSLRLLRAEIWARDDVKKIHYRAPVTPAGELEVRDGCDGPLLASLPLAPALASQGVTRLKAPLGATGSHDLCFTFTQSRLDPFWVLDRVTLGPLAKEPRRGR